ncbi:MAG: hypothetical protein IH962_05240 [Chloroflexi bacterium]|nr:hypothetical protein [Chloroflexota bacterium]
MKLPRLRLRSKVEDFEMLVPADPAIAGSLGYDILVASWERSIDLFRHSSGYVYNATASWTSELMMERF